MMTLPWHFTRIAPSVVGMYVARSAKLGQAPQRISLWFDGKLTFLDGRLFGAGISICGEWHTVADLEFAGPFIVDGLQRVEDGFVPHDDGKRYELVDHDVETTHLVTPKDGRWKYLCGDGHAFGNFTVYGPLPERQEKAQS